MGAQGSTVSNIPVPTNEIKLLSTATHFSPDEVAAISERFKSFSEQQYLKQATLSKLLKIENQFLSECVYNAFNIDDNPNGISFKNFVTALSNISPRASVEEKAVFVFKLYDIKKQNLILKEDLNDFINNVIQQNQSIQIPQEMLNSLVNDTFSSTTTADVISLNDFKLSAKSNPQILSIIKFSTDGLFI